MPKHSPKVSPKLEADLRDRLEDLLDERDDVDAKRRRVAKALKGHLTILDDSITLVRRQLKGQDLDQTEIPGTQLPEPAKDPVVAEILRLAGGIVEREPEEEEEEADVLTWEAADEGTFTAAAPGGTYRLGPAVPDGWALHWEPDGKAPNSIATYAKRRDAEKAAERHIIERAGDAILRNAGDGKLARAPRGGPIARKRRRR